MAKVLSVNISKGGIPKLPVEACDVTVQGLDGDGHDHDKHNSPDRAVSVFDQEILLQLVEEGYELYPGAIGENLTLEDVHVQALHPGDRLAFSGGVEIELVEARKPCFVLDPLGEELKADIVGRSGYLARVIVEGNISPGETILVTEAT
jgi:MOSC domain-containing protein YiiM